jgi:hypothetical protein
MFEGATGWEQAIGLDKAKLDPPPAGVARTKNGTDACVRHEG